MSGRQLFVAAAVVALAYLGECLFGPVAGSIARGFGQPEAQGYAFISAAFYGSAVSGVIILLIVDDRWLDRWIAGGLCFGAALTMLALVAPGWTMALAMRFASGAGFGISVAGVVILLAQRRADAALARELSLIFSIVFLFIALVMAALPHATAVFGLSAVAASHAGLCLAAAVVIGPALHHRTARRVVRLPCRLSEVLPRIFWCPGKTTAFGLHAANLFASLLLLLGMQAALSAKGVDQAGIGLVLAALSAATAVGGLVHAWIVRRCSLRGARWALLGAETAALLVAALLLATDVRQAPLLAAVALATKGVCGGPPSFEAMLYDMGPRDATAAGLQRSLGMIAAITAATVVLATLCAVRTRHPVGDGAGAGAILCVPGGRARETERGSR